MATVLCVVWVLCQISIAQNTDTTLGGFFETTLLVTQTSSLTVKSISLNAFLKIGNWLTTMDAKFTDSQFDTLTFYTSGALGELTLNSSVVFNPSTLAFVSWQSGTSFNLLDLAVSDVLYVALPQSSSYNLLTLSGTAQGISFQGTFKTGICPLCFWEGSLCASWLWAICNANFQACIQASDAGFKSLSVSMTDFSPFGEILGIAAILDTAISFTADSKTFSPTLRIVPDWEICVDLELLGEISISGTPIEVTTMLLYGLVGECTLDNGVTFTFAESLDPAKNSAVTGKSDYWEMLKVSGPVRSCCEDEGSFEIAAYFGGDPPPPSSLFGVGLIRGSFDLRLMDQFGFVFAGEYPLNGTGWSLSFTFRVFW